MSVIDFSLARAAKFERKSPMEEAEEALRSFEIGTRREERRRIVENLRRLSRERPGLIPQIEPVLALIELEVV